MCVVKVAMSRFVMNLFGSSFCKSVDESIIHDSCGFTMKILQVHCELR